LASPLSGRSTVDGVKLSRVDAYEEGSVFIVGFRGRDNEDAIVFQLASKFDEHDALLDTYSISSATGATVYGGVTAAAASEGVVALTLREDAAASLGVSPVLRPELPDQAAAAVAVEGLRRVGVVVES
jgi:hypothetical protein